MRLLDKQPSVSLTLFAKIMACAFPKPPPLFQRRAVVQALCLLDLFVRLKPSLVFQTPVRIMPSALKLESTLSHARAVARGTLAIIAKLPKKVIVVPPATRVLQLPSDVASDTASCKCDSRYIGETCDIDLVFLIALPLAIGSCCWVLFLLESPVSPGR